MCKDTNTERKYVEMFLESLSRNFIIFRINKYLKFQNEKEVFLIWQIWNIETIKIKASLPSWFAQMRRYHRLKK